MPDWQLYRAKFLDGDLKAQNLARLQTMEKWLELPFAECQTAAHTQFDGQNEDALRPWYQLSRAFYLKLLQEAGFTGPQALEQERQLYAKCQEGTATQQEWRTAAHLFNIGQISAVLTALQPNIPQLSAGALEGNATRQKIGPLSMRLMGLNTAPGLVKPSTVDTLEQLLQESEQLAAEASPENTGRLDSLYFCGATALALGDANANLGRSDAAFGWYAKSADFYAQANERDKADEAREKAAALELAVTGDIDRATQRILGGLLDQEPAENALARAMAYANLSRVMEEAGDSLAAGENAGRAARAFEQLGFKDPEKAGTEEALDSWIRQACERANGKDIYRLVMRVVNAYLAVFSGRVAQYAASDPDRARRNEELTRGMAAITSRIQAETEAADEELKAKVQAYFPQQTAMAEPPPVKDDSFERVQQISKQVDDALLQVRAAADQLAAAGQAVDSLLAVLGQAGSLVEALEMPLYRAKWKLAYAYVHMTAGDTQAMLADAEQARVAILDGKPAKLSSFRLAYERAIYLEAVAQKTRALMMRGEFRIGLDTCLETIADFEESRYRVNAPLRQSALLASMVEFYTAAAFAAFKLQEWDRLLEVTELVKARSAVRSRLSGDAPPFEIEALAKQFEELTKALQGGLQGQDLEDLKARRRDLWDLMAIARARAAGAADPPVLSVTAVQSALGKDEAAIGYFFLAPNVVVIIKIDRERCEVERPVWSSDQLETVNELLQAIEQLEATGPLDLDDAIRAAGEILIPPGVRAFVEGKSRVIISPHHALHLFPFHAVSWGGKSLIERAAVRYVPNFSSLLLEWRGLRNTGVFAVGVSRFQVPGEAWPELKNTEAQCAEIAATYARSNLKTETLTGASATTSAFRARASAGGLSGFSTLHLATHGTSVFARDVENEPMESKLVLEDGTIDGLELARFRLPADVAVLSACNSGQRAVGGRGMAEVPGDDIFGLQSALFQAGVHTVLGTLWPVETQAAYQVTADFHAHYAGGDLAEIALQKALTRLSAATGSASTFVWAPFFLTSLGVAGGTAG